MLNSIRRYYAPLLEILRCLLYITYDFSVVTKNEWNLTESEQFLVLNLIWFVRGFHMSSIMLWIVRYVFYHEGVYIVQKTVDNKFNEIEKVQLKQLGSKWTIIFIFISLLIGALVIITIAALQVDYCSKFLDIAFRV